MVRLVRILSELIRVRSNKIGVASPSPSTSYEADLDKVQNQELVITKIGNNLRN